MMSFKGHEGFGQVASGAGGGAPVPWWAASQMLYGEPLSSSSSSPDAETRRAGQFQVVPRAQAVLDPAVPPSPAPKSGAPEVLKFSVFQGEPFLLAVVLWNDCKSLVVGSVHATTMPVNRRECHDSQG
jgi:nuclear transcription factor Y alpha